MESPPPERPVLLFPSREPEKNPASGKQAVVKAITKEELVGYQEEQLVQNAVRVVPQMFKAIMKGLKAGNSKSIDQAAQIYGFIKSSPGLVFNLQNNVFGAESKEGMYFEGVIRGLEARDRPDGDVTVDVESETAE